MTSLERMLDTAVAELVEALPDGDGSHGLRLLDRHDGDRGGHGEHDRASGRRSRLVWVAAAAASIALIVGIAVLVTRPAPVIAPATAPTSLALDPTGPTADPSPDATPSPTSAAPSSWPSVTEHTTVAAGAVCTGRVAMYGESVTLGAVPELQAAGIVVDAAVARQGHDLIAVLERDRMHGLLDGVVVIHPGTNGSIGLETLDAIVGLLDRATRVVVVTAHANRGWIAANNALLRDLPARDPRFVVLDWDVLASAHPEWLATDGIHLSAPQGARPYADAVAAAAC